MPLNKKYNLEMLMDAARAYPLRPREWITFEYVLMGGVNDSPENAREVVELLLGMRCKVNLIALNPGPGIDFDNARGGARRGLPDSFARGRNSSVCAASARARYLCGLRAA
jgi:adenine C2-methylase RlmN of 23S rRNA A2503 and tRNA A37